MKFISTKIAHINVVIIILMILMTCASFITAHHVSASFEFRFLFSALLLTACSLYLRFLTPSVETIHRVLYRITTVFAIWSIGFYFVPSADAVLYLVMIPGYFYLFRAEMKPHHQAREDILVAGVLFAITAFLYVQQQPLRIILFPQDAFIWIDYLKHAPALFLSGLGFIRLQKHVKWKGLALLGCVLLLSGLVLFASYWLFSRWQQHSYSVSILFFGHLALLFLFFKHPLKHHFFQFAGLTISQRKHLKNDLFILINLTLQLQAFYLITCSELTIWPQIGIFCSLLALLYQFRQHSFKLLLLEIALIAYPYYFYQFPALANSLTLILAILVIISIAIHRSPRFYYYTSYQLMYLLLCLFLLCSLSSPILNPLGLLKLAFVLVCWLLLPARPIHIGRKYHFLLWPFFSAIILVCLNRGYDSILLGYWALANILIPAMLYLLIRNQSCQAYCVKKQWLFIFDWLDHVIHNFQLLIIGSLGIGIAAFVVNYHAIMYHHAYIIILLMTLVINLIISVSFTIKTRLIPFAWLSELHIGLILILLRWKFEMMDTLSLGSPIDGYLLLVIAGIAAGLKEVIRKQTHAFEHQFNRGILLYGVLGWIYMMLTQTTQIDLYHSEISSLYMSLLFYWLSKSTNRSNLILTFVFANAALFAFFYHHTLTNSQFYIIPVTGSMLVLAQLFKDQLTTYQLKNIRLIGSLIIITSSSFYNLVEFNNSIGYPVSAVFFSTLAVLIGTSLRIRIYLYLGITAFFVNIISVTGYMIVAQPPEHIKLIIGILFLISGLLFTASFLLFQIKRQEILAKYHHIMGDIKRWD